MFEDHRSINIYNALLEAEFVRKLRDMAIATNSIHAGSIAGSRPPMWVAFNIRQSCECCQLPFSWHTTFRGQPKEFRERHNCRNCGKLVCTLCSQNRRPIPRLGMVQPRRICDRCFSSGSFLNLS
jgi:hypothetical protein